MTISDTVMVTAVLLGPVIAVQVQKLIETWRTKRERQISIFRILMATRGTPVSFKHVEALNLIDIEFCKNNKKETAVRDTWKLYLDHLGDGPNDYSDPNYQTRLDAWSSKSIDLLIDMLFTMSESLGYKFDKVQLKKGAYTPRGHSDLELEQSLLRRGFLDILFHKNSIPVTPVNNEK